MSITGRILGRCTADMQWDFQQWLLVFLLLTLFFKEEMKSFVASKLGVKTGVDKMEDKVDWLKVHYNDDLEQQLNHMDGKLDSISVNTSTIRAKQDEWDRFGIPVRTKT